MGMMVTAPGTSMLPMTSAKMSFLPGKSTRRQRAYAAMVDVRSTPTSDGSVITSVLMQIAPEGELLSARRGSSPTAGSAGHSSGG